jgi:hypothetical protein
MKDGPKEPNQLEATMSLVRSKLTFANVTSMIALLVALSGTALALQNNSVKSRHIANGHVRAADFGPITVRAATTEEPIPGGAAHNGAYDTDSIRAECLDGETALSGGGDFVPTTANPDLELFIQDSHPTALTNDGFHAWQVRGGNDSGENAYLAAYVVCLRAGP